MCRLELLICRALFGICLTSALSVVMAEHCVAQLPAAALPPAKIAWSEEILLLRQQVMWPGHPAEYSAVEGDKTEAIHFGIRLPGDNGRLVSVVSLWLSSDVQEAQFRKYVH